MSVSCAHSWEVCHITAILFKGMSAKLQSVNELLKRDVKFVYTANHQAIVQETLNKLSSPEVLAFPDYAGAIFGK